MTTPTTKPEDFFEPDVWAGMSDDDKAKATEFFGKNQAAIDKKLEEAKKLEDEFNAKLEAMQKARDEEQAYLAGLKSTFDELRESGDSTKFDEHKKRVAKEFEKLFL